MKFSKRCKLCIIGFEEPTTLNKLHNLRLKDNYSLRLLEEDANRVIQESENERIKGLEKISYVAVQNHFSKHTPIEAKVKYKSQNLTNITRKTRQELEVPTEVAVELKKIEKERVNLFEDLTDLYLLLRDRFEKFDVSQGGVIDIGGPGDPGNLVGYSVLSKELRTCLAELNKMKQAEQLTKNVLHFSLQHYTKIIIEEIIRELENLRRVLVPHIKDQKIIDDIINSVQHNFGTYITKGASETLQKTNNQFNLS